MSSFCKVSGESLILAFGKWTSKAMIKRYLAENESNATNPRIEMIITETGQFTTPEELRKLAGCTYIPFTNRKRSFFGSFNFSEKTKKWKVE